VPLTGGAATGGWSASASPRTRTEPSSPSSSRSTTDPNETVPRRTAPVRRPPECRLPETDHPNVGFPRPTTDTGSRRRSAVKETVPCDLASAPLHTVPAHGTFATLPGRHHRERRSRGCRRTIHWAPGFTV